MVAWLVFIDFDVIMATNFLQAVSSENKKSLYKTKILVLL